RHRRVRLPAVLDPPRRPVLRNRDHPRRAAVRLRPARLVADQLRLRRAAPGGRVRAADHDSGAQPAARDGPRLAGALRGDRRPPAVLLQPVAALTAGSAGAGGAERYNAAVPRTLSVGDPFDDLASVLALREPDTRIRLAGAARARVRASRAVIE